MSESFLVGFWPNIELVWDAFEMGFLRSHVEADVEFDCGIELTAFVPILAPIIFLNFGFSIEGLE